MEQIAQRTRVDGVVIGVLMGFAADGAPLVVYRGNPGEAAVAARTTAVLASDDVGREVALLFEGGDPARPLVVGRLVRPEAVPTLVVRDGVEEVLQLTAEREIVRHANETAQNLSGGDLAVELAPHDPDDGREEAFDLVVRRAGQPGTTPVTYLSGSERFRVAVAVAVAIGRFASGRARPLRSVIIDEGFGCLDRHGRQVMIQELQNLRGHLRCILLVSHQEEFAEAFPDGYRFELTNGTPVATRFQR